MLHDIKTILTKNYPYIFNESIEPSDIDSIEKITRLIENYYQGIISCMPGNIYWCDEKGNGVGCNQNVLNFIGLSSVQDFKGLSFEKTGEMTGWSPDSIESFKKDSLEVIRTGKTKASIEEPLIINQHGNSITFLTTRAPLLNSHKKVIGMVGVSIDISERKKMEAELREAKLVAENADRSKSEFIGNISHDLKTPLAGIIATAEWLARTLKEEQQIDLVYNIAEAGKQLLMFFDNCLEIAKVENSNALPPIEFFNAKKMLGDLLELFKPAIENKHLGLHLYYDPRIPEFLSGRQGAIYRIMMNLLGNAIKFTKKGNITVGAEFAKETANNNVIIIKFFVQDTGPGIPRDKHQHIFERFTRLDHSNKGVYTGSGLGLYLVKKLINSLDGEILLDSEENKGSRFTIVLPLGVPLLSPHEYQPSQLKLSHLLKNCEVTLNKPVTLYQEAMRSDNKSFKILLVEDNPIVQKITYLMLSSFKCQTDVASIGAEALQLFTPGKYDMVLLDLGLPDIQGYEIAQHFREKEKNSSISVPIIASTAHTSIEVENKCINAGINTVTSKPLSVEKILQFFQDYL